MTKLGGGLIVDSILPESGGISTVTFTRNHAFSGISTASLFTAGSGTRTNGTYYNVKLYNENTYSTWNGATAIVSIDSNTIQSFQIQAPGSGYSGGSDLFFDNAAIGGNQDGAISILTAGITTSVGDVVQVTGIATIADAYYRITSIPTPNRISIAKTSGDPATNRKEAYRSSQWTFNFSKFFYIPQVGITTFTCASAHGLSCRK